MEEAKFLGVCAWVASQVGMEAKMVRIIFLVAVLFFGIGIASYFITYLIKLIVD